MMLNPRTRRTRESRDAASCSPFLVASQLDRTPVGIATGTVSERTDEAEIPDWVYRRIDLPDRDSGDQLAERIVASVQDRLGSHLEVFQVSVLEDGLALRGVVKTFYSKRLAQEVARETSGLAILANDIEVRFVDLTEGGHQVTTNECPLPR